MARILDKLIPPTAARAVKLRQSYDWAKAERDAIPAKYEEKKENFSIDTTSSKGIKQILKLKKLYLKLNFLFCLQKEW